MIGFNALGQLGRLGNQMFQIATAYSYAKTQSASLRLLRTKVEEDGRSMYWDTVLSRFTSFLTDHDLFKFWGNNISTT